MCFFTRVAQAHKLLVHKTDLRRTQLIHAYLLKSTVSEEDATKNKRTTKISSALTRKVLSLRAMHSHPCIKQDKSQK